MLFLINNKKFSNWLFVQHNKIRLSPTMNVILIKRDINSQVSKTQNLIKTFIFWLTNFNLTKNVKFNFTSIKKLFLKLFSQSHSPKVIQSVRIDRLFHRHKSENFLTSSDGSSAWKNSRFSKQDFESWCQIWLRTRRSGKFVHEFSVSVCTWTCCSKSAKFGRVPSVSCKFAWAWLYESATLCVWYPSCNESSSSIWSN